ncbi:hypothetical protein D9M68_849270 [compost metagenome]
MPGTEHEIHLCRPRPDALMRHQIPHRLLGRQGFQMLEIELPRYHGLGNHPHGAILAARKTGGPHLLLAQRQISLRIERARQLLEPPPDRSGAGH